MAFKKTGFKKEKKSDLIPVGALWASRSGNGFNGSFNRDTAAFIEAVESVGLEGLRLVVFENTFKKGERDPDFKLYVSPKRGSDAPKIESEEAEEAPAPKKAKKAPLPWDNEATDED